MVNRLLGVIIGWDVTQKTFASAFQSPHKSIESSNDMSKTVFKSFWILQGIIYIEVGHFENCSLIFGVCLFYMNAI